MSHSTVRRPHWHYGAPVAINFTSVLLSFLSKILLARLIGPTSFGLFTLWQNNVQLFGTLGTFGQQNYVLKELAHAKHPRSDEARRIALAAVKLVIAVSATGGVIGAAFFLTLQDGLPGAAALQLVGTMMFALLVTLSAVHRGLGSLILGVLFDRLIYQILFILLLLFAGGVLAANLLHLQSYTAVLVIAAVLSFSFLLFELGIRLPALFRSHAVRGQARRVFPFFVVNSLWVVNGRYLLGYCGIFLQGAVLGEIGLVVSTIGMMIIPTATLNLVVAPVLARRLARPGWGRIILLYLFAVSVLVLAGVLLVYFAYPFIFRIAHIGLTIPSGFVVLLCTAFGLTIVGNAGLLVEQLRGRAIDAARLFSVVMATKLGGGYWIADHYGIIALLWADMVLGGLFVLLLLGRLLRSREMPSLQPLPTDGVV